jgi:hypothetical protein
MKKPVPQPPRVRKATLAPTPNTAPAWPPPPAKPIVSPPDTPDVIAQSWRGWLE